MHAYLIMAHGNFEVLKTLISLLDDERNHIYIHIDKKVKSFPFAQFASICKKSKVFFTKKRINGKWAHHSLVQCELELFKAAVQGNYRYYHLLSGVDLPLKSQHQIHAFFESANNKNFVQGSTDLAAYTRLSRYYLSVNPAARFMKKVQAFFNTVQYHVHTDRFKKYGFNFAKGAQWCSLTHDFAAYLVQNKKIIRKMTRFTNAPDECYKQIMLLNSSFKNTQINNNYRYTQWADGSWSPKTFTAEDYNSIMASDCLFARKFSEADMDIVNYIVKSIQNT